MSMQLWIFRLEQIISSGGWQVDDLCLHAEIRADPHIINLQRG